MFRIIGCVLLPLLLAGCSTMGEVSHVQKKSLGIQSGMSKAAVKKVFGTPAGRSFNDNQEVWQYCETGETADKYIAVWFVDDEVRRLTSHNIDFSKGRCPEYFPSVTWVSRKDGVQGILNR